MGLGACYVAAFAQGSGVLLWAGYEMSIACGYSLLSSCEGIMGTTDEEKLISHMSLKDSVGSEEVSCTDGRGVVGE